MSMHKSLVSKNKLERQRSVLTRAERLKILGEDGRWKDGDSVFGLPKVRTIVATKVGKKTKKAKEEATLEGAEAAPAAPAEGGAKAAPPAKQKKK
ncbi:MAG: small basic protein [Planctomycetota bacterium]|nr:small basic protein [Planctomycetota bacterium]